MVMVVGRTEEVILGRGSALCGSRKVLWLQERTRRLLYLLQGVGSLAGCRLNEVENGRRAYTLVVVLLLLVMWEEDGG